VVHKVTGRLSQVQNVPSYFTVHFKYFQTPLRRFWPLYKDVYFLTHTDISFRIKSINFLKLFCDCYTEFPSSTYRILSKLPDLRHQEWRWRRAAIEHTALLYTSHSLRVNVRRSYPTGSSLPTVSSIPALKNYSERAVGSVPATQPTPDLPYSTHNTPLKPPPDYQTYHTLHTLKRTGAEANTFSCGQPFYLNIRWISDSRSNGVTILQSQWLTK
jgi:hypothetical protein